MPLNSRNFNRDVSSDQLYLVTFRFATCWRGCQICLVYFLNKLEYFFDIIFSKTDTSLAAKLAFSCIPYTPNSSAYNFLIRAQGFSSSVVNLDHCFWMRPWCKIQVATSDGNANFLDFLCFFVGGKYG